MTRFLRLACRRIQPKPPRECGENSVFPTARLSLGRGANTGEELRNAKRYLAGTDAKRVGLLTSAWHMPRALRHAERNGLKVVPIPADFWTDHPPEPLLFSLVPSAEAIAFTHRAILEYLAMAVGR